MAGKISIGEAIRDGWGTYFKDITKFIMLVVACGVVGLFYGCATSPARLEARWDPDPNNPRFVPVPGHTNAEIRVSINQLVEALESLRDAVLEARMLNDRAGEERALRNYWTFVRNDPQSIARVRGYYQELLRLTSLAGQAERVRRALPEGAFN